MPRPKSERNSAHLDAEIARLEQERKRLVQAEDQRRGSIVREFLATLNGNQLRDVLRPFVTSRDAFLFGLELTSSGTRHRTADPIVKESVGAPRANAAG